MGQDGQPGRDRHCARCGKPVGVIYTAPESGAFTSCGCGTRPIMQDASSRILFLVAAGITFTASLLITIH